MESSTRGSGGTARPGRQLGEGVKTLGGYEIIAKVGQGGMGAVFRARQISMDRIVALKILPQRIAQDPKAKERFLREARICAGLNHANLINGIDCGEAGGYMYFAMEFVEGETVKSLHKRKGRLQPAECLKIVRQAAAALDYAHSKKLVHRDVKPDNIMLMPDGTAKLCDLGLARSTANIEDSSLTQSGQSLGTPHYISPEQARGEEVDARTDIYALGATMYHLLAGQPVFDGNTPAVIMAKHITESSPALTALNPAISDDLAYIVSKMLAKKPGDRYANIAQFVADLDAVESGRAPIAAQFKGASSCARPVGGKNKAATRQVAPITAREGGAKAVRTGGAKKNSPVGVWIGAGLALLAVLAVVGSGLGSGTDKVKRVAVENPKTPPVPAVPAPSLAPTLPTPVPVAPPAPASANTPKTEAVTADPKSIPATMPAVDDTAVKPALPAPPPPVQPIAPPPPISVTVKADPPVPPVAPVPSGPSSAESQLARSRFLTEILHRTAKQELVKVRKDAGELATHAEYAAAKELIAQDLKDLDKAVEFEQNALESIGEQKPTIALPAGNPLRALGTDKVKVEKYEAHGLEVKCADAQTRLSPVTLPAQMIVDLGALKGRDADAVNYLMARGAVADARKLLPLLTEAQREHLNARLELAKSGEAELAAQVAFEELSKLVQSKQWKQAFEKAAAFDAAHAGTAVAKNNAIQLDAFKSLAAENLNPVSKFFHAKAAKQLPDGAIELSYDFSDPAQAADFACEHGALTVDKGRLVVPSGGGEWAQARFLPPVGEIVRFEVTGKTLSGAHRFGIYILAAKSTDGSQAPRCMCRVYDHHLHLEQWGVPNIIGTATADWNKDTNFLAELQADGQLKWTVDGTEIGKVKVPATAAGGHIAMISVDGNHSWTNFKVTFKPEPTWLADQRKGAKP